MPVRSVLAATLACALALLAPAAAPAGTLPSRCHAKRGEKLLGFSGQAMVFGSRDHGTLTGCLRRTGRRRVLYRGIPDDAAYPEGYGAVRLAGTKVLYDVWSASPHDSGEEFFVEDVADARSVRNIARDFDDFESDVPDGGYVRMAIRADGTAALLYEAGDRTSRTLYVMPARGGRQVVAVATRISGVALAGRMLRWREDDVPQAVVATPPDRCPSTFASGSHDVGVFQRKDVLKACWRETGQIASVAGAVSPWSADEPAQADIAGSFVAATLGHEAIAVLDTRTGSVIAINAPGVRQAVVDAAGSLAWTARVGEEGAQRGEVWVRDGRGTALVMTTPDVLPTLDRIGSTVRWWIYKGASGSFTLSP